MVVVTSLFNLVISSFHHTTWQRVLSCMNMAVDLSRWFQQRCSSLFVHQAMNSLFQHHHTSSYNRHTTSSYIEQACQQPCSICPAQPCSSLSTGKNKPCLFTCVLYMFPECKPSCLVRILKSQNTSKQWAWTDLIKPFVKTSGILEHTYHFDATEKPRNKTTFESFVIKSFAIFKVGQ